MKKVLVTCPMHPAFAAMLTDAGFSVDSFPEMTQEEVAAAVGNYAVLIVTTKTNVNAALIDAGAKLEVIGRSGSGLDTIDVPYATAKGIACFNSPEGNCNAVAEHAMAMVLALSNNLIKADREVRAGYWLREENRGFEWKGKTIGIIGYGYTGSAFARKWQGFDVQVLAYDKYKKGFGNDAVNEVNYNTLLQKADLISFHVPLTAETKGWVNHEFVKSLQRPIVIMNTARGPIVDLEALQYGLEAGKLLGACLDVLPEEPPIKWQTHDSFRQLLSDNRVVFSPHIAGWSTASHKLLSTCLAEKILAYYGIS